MLRAIKKFITIILYAFITLLGVTLAMGNRASMKLSLFPFPYEISMPIFLLVILLFIAGMLIGWSLARLATGRVLHLSKQSHKRVHALENELAAMRTEQHNRLAPFK